MTKTTFAKIKIGQLFQYGEGYGMVTYRKMNSAYASPAFGQEFQIFEFKRNALVLPFVEKAWQLPQTFV